MGQRALGLEAQIWPLYLGWRTLEIKSLKENVDFYWDELGRMVLTKEYLLKRGYCCENGDSKMDLICANCWLVTKSIAFAIVSGWIPERNGNDHVVIQ